ncbi:long-chain fatty acid transport protein [Devosia sp. YR412]|uniref:OmpP1/FadL family transporter n=1 Tax=Devosia sp. YR412 TaxID=1881030 RepID=UPI0008CD671F|nr:outer membrane protein transport protein [Devosia sp. YR412]SEP98043.1 long-chain fatty acid transport protein [Devosia sp. YR412]
MARSPIRSLALAALVATSTIGAAHAGGLEANGYNWDLLFDPGTYVGKGTVTQVTINHDITAPGLGTISTSPARTYYNVAAKADLFGASSCLVSVQNPFGSGTDRDAAYARTSRQALSERIWSNDVGLTCAYGFDVGSGVFSVIGGISAQQLNYDATIARPAPLPVGNELVTLSGSGTGWRAGIAYEVPEIALRVSAIYNAAIDYNLTGRAYGSLLPQAAANANATTPQSIEIKAQSGIAPGWLALGSVKWVDWSVLNTLTVNNAVAPITTVLNYEDGWTVSAGVGHQLTDELTVLGSLTWDKGTSRKNANGVLLNGTQTDRWGASLGAAYKPSANFELSGGVSYSLIGAGSNLQNESWNTGSVLAFSVSAKATF